MNSEPKPLYSGAMQVGMPHRVRLIKKDAEQTPEQRFRAHVLGVVRVAVRAFEKDVVQILREEAGIVLK